jgi:hypothetical protein
MKNGSAFKLTYRVGNACLHAPLDKKVEKITLLFEAGFKLNVKEIVESSIWNSVTMVRAYSLYSAW